MHKTTSLIATLLILLVSTGLQAQPSPNAKPMKESKGPSPVKSVEKGLFGSTRNVHQCGNVFFAGQFGKDDLSKIKAKKFARVITLRTKGEVKWDEKGLVEKSKMNFVEVPFRAPDSLTDDVFGKIRKLMADEETRTFFHCGSANRVGAVWLPYRVLDEGVDLKQALAEAKEIGLRSKAYEEKALDYIQRMQKAKSETDGKEKG